MIDGSYKGKYIGKSICGFLHGVEYAFEISNNGRTYQLYAFEDLTLGASTDLHITYASEASIRRNWEIEERNKVFN